MKSGKILSFLLALTLITACFSAAANTTATAADAENWTGLQSAIAAASNGDIITLSRDITAAAADTMLEVTGNKSITIDLAGHTLNRGRTSPDADGHVIIVRAGSTLNLRDSVGTGVVTGGYANNGGGIHNRGTLIIEGVTISGNHVNSADNTYRGGAIYSSGTVSITDSVISNNDGDDGGAVCNDEGGTLTMNGVTLDSNRSINHGGGALLNYGSATLIGCTVTNNTAKGAGGGIWSRDSLTVRGCVINGNTTQSTGGGICANAGTLTADGSTLITNNTSGDGGAIYINSGTTANLSNVMISGNRTTTHGGGGITNYGTLSLSGSVTVTGNRSVGNGGGIWHGGDNFRMQDTVIINGNSKGSDNNNLYLSNKKVIKLTGAVTEQSRIGISAQYYLTDVTDGWSTYQSNTGIYTTVFIDDIGAQATDSEDLPMFKLSGGEVALNSYFVERFEDGTEIFRLLPWDVKMLSDIMNDDGSMIYGANLVGYIVVDKDFPSITTRLEIFYGNYFPTYLIIPDGITMICYSGIYVTEGAEGLRVYGQKNDSGVLNAYGANLGEAGIGSISPNPDVHGHGKIEIHGATVNATGASDAAGIGGGNEAGMAASFGDIKIFGGIVNAQGGQYAAGIGGGDGQYGANIYIYGGTVTARGGQYGAGIGTGDEPVSKSGGNDAKYGNVYIYGGTVTAYGGEQAAGIGGGNEGVAHSVTITGGVVTARGGNIAAAIGAGDDSDGCDVTVTGGTVTLVSDEGIYIGSPNEDNHGALNVSGDMCVTTVILGMNVKAARDNRGGVLRTKTSGTVTLEVCDHEGGISYATSAAGHTKQCANCYHTFEPEPHELDDNARCTVCNYQASFAVVSFARGGGSGSMNDVNVVPGREYTLPSCGFAAPVNALFIGWQIGEDIKQPGESVTVNSNTTLTAMWATPGLSGGFLEFGYNITAFFAFEKKWIDEIGCNGMLLELEADDWQLSSLSYAARGNHYIIGFNVAPERFFDTVEITLTGIRAGDVAVDNYYCTLLDYFKDGCDVNSDGATDIKDFVRYKKNVCGIPVSEDPEAPAQAPYDLDFSGAVNDLDIGYLRKILMF